MPNYLRLYEPGATYFFTLVTHGRRRFLTTPLARTCLREAWRDTVRRNPFRLVAVCLLPDHLHCLWSLPDGDADFSSRWRFLKAQFTRKFLARGGREGEQTTSRIARRERAVWQRRFWEHRIRDEKDFARHFDYVHFNPVKHELVTWPEDWPWSTFHRYLAKGWYETRWGRDEPPSIHGLDVPE